MRARARNENTRNATGLSPGVLLSRCELNRCSRSAGRHPCSTAWLDVRDFHPAMRGRSLAAELALRVLHFSFASI
jgi:hypothetical protein